MRHDALYRPALYQEPCHTQLPPYSAIRHHVREGKVRCLTTPTVAKRKTRPLPFSRQLTTDLEQIEAEPAIPEGCRSWLWLCLRRTVQYAMRAVQVMSSLHLYFPKAGRLSLSTERPVS